jgi:hypothetical protein
VQLLGNVGSLYMVFLILLLIFGLGMLGMGFINYIMKPKGTKNKNKILINGGTSMQSNGWLKLALFSFVGIIISGVVLQFMTPANAMGYQGANAHQPMQQQSMPQGNMGGMSMSASGQVDMGIIINRLDQMQMQINQMQQQMMNGGNMQMQTMPQGGSMGGMQQGGSGMGMMNMPMGNMGGASGGSGSMGGMSSGSGSMGGMSGGSSSGSSSSGGGMGMMGGMM